MKHKPRILITNDDGIHAPGIEHLWRAIAPFADVTIVAPLQDQSGTGLSITTRHPLHVQKIRWHEGAVAWSVSGTPSDCVKIALSVVMEEKAPDLILSGINKGGNAGRNVLYSGTVGGAIEGVLRGIPAIAFSCDEFDNPNYAAAGEYVPQFVQHVLEHPLPDHTILNVTFPKGEAKGVRLAKQGKQYWMEDPQERRHPFEGHTYYWLGAKLAKFHDEADDSDIALLNQGFITAVPLHVGSLTDHEELERRQSAFDLHFGMAAKS